MMEEVLVVGNSTKAINSSHETKGHLLVISIEVTFSGRRPSSLKRFVGRRAKRQKNEFMTTGSDGRFRWVFLLLRILIAKWISALKASPKASSVCFCFDSHSDIVRISSHWSYGPAVHRCSLQSRNLQPF